MFASLFQRNSSGKAEVDPRLRMVEEQLRARGIRDERLLGAMAKIPREPFVCPEEFGNAYGDHPVPIGAGQTISQPYIVAAMLEKLQLQPRDRVLEVGTGTGYQAAVLAELAGEVWTVERHAELARKAQSILHNLGYSNIHVVNGDGSRGLPAQAPFDKIVVSAAAPKIPEALTAQLAEAGRMIVPVGSRDEQQLQLVRKSAGQVLVTSEDLCRFVPLVGEQGWSQ